MSVYAFGPFQLDADRLLLLEGSEPMPVGPKVVETLLALVERPGEVLAKAAMLDRIWPEGFVEEANLAQNIYVLRKLLRARWNVDAIETIPRRGYRFRCAVTVGDRVTQSARPTSPPLNRRTSWYAAATAALLGLFLAGTVTYALLSQDRPVTAHSRPLSSAGSRLFAIGRYYWNQRTRAGVTRSVTYFQQVVAAEPQAAQGYAGLASAYAIMGDYGFGRLGRKAYFARAKMQAHTALALDARSSLAYGALAVVAINENRSKEAALDLKRAIESDPSEASAHEWQGIAFLEKGQLESALRELRTAADLDPLSVSTVSWLSSAAYLGRRYEDAIAYGRETLDLDPARSEVWQSIGLAYEAEGYYDRSVDAFKRYAAGCASCRADADALLAAVYARERHYDQARRVLAMAQSHPHGVETDLALAFDAVGERRAALSWLRRMPNDFLRMQIANDARFDALRDAYGERVLAADRPA